MYNYYIGTTDHTTLCAYCAQGNIGHQTSGYDRVDSIKVLVDRQWSFIIVTCLFII